MLQTFVPLFSAALPFASNVLGFFNGAEIPWIAPVGAFLLSWGPFINSCSTVLLFGAYRRAVGRLLASLPGCPKNTAVRTISTVERRTPLSLRSSA